VIDAVVFDLDGLLIETEEIWDEVREALARERGGTWTESAQRDMMGMSSTEWSRYMHDEIGLAESPQQINDLVVERMAERYQSQLPLLPGAVEAVERIAAHWPLGVASSSNRGLIDLVLELSGLAPYFAVTVSSEEVARGKPAPDVYLEAARRLGRDPIRCAAIEDSENGVRSAAAADMRVIAIPNQAFPPSPETLRLAHVVIASLAELEPGLIDPERAGKERGAP
jgi:HAD superfamily hydrolase (TIGR01509 family)